MILFKILLLTTFVYLVWRKIGREYVINDVLLYVWSSLLAFLVAGRVVYGLLNWGIWDTWVDWVLVWRVSGMTYWGAIGGVIGWTWYFSSLKKWKFLNVAEEMTPFYLFLGSGMLLSDYLWGGWQLEMLGWAVNGVIVLLMALIIKEKYRSFVWYPSGKKGFVFWWSMLFYSLFSVLWLVYLREPLIYSILWGGLSLTSLIGLFILGDTFTNLSIFKGGRKK